MKSFLKSILSNTIANGLAIAISIFIASLATLNFDLEISEDVKVLLLFLLISSVVMTIIIVFNLVLKQRKTNTGRNKIRKLKKNSFAEYSALYIFYKENAINLDFEYIEDNTFRNLIARDYIKLYYDDPNYRHAVTSISLNIDIFDELQLEFRKTKIEILDKKVIDFYLKAKKNLK